MGGPFWWINVDQGGSADARRLRAFELIDPRRADLTTERTRQREGARCGSPVRLSPTSLDRVLGWMEHRPILSFQGPGERRGPLKRRRSSSRAGPSGMAGTPPRAPGVPHATPGIRPDGTDKFTVLLDQWGCDPKVPPPGHLVAYVYHMDQTHQWGEQFYPSGKNPPAASGLQGLFGPSFGRREDFVPARGRWYCYEFMAHVNTPGQRDGRVAFWVDGRLAADFPNLRFRTVEALKINRVDFGCIEGGPGVCSGYGSATLSWRPLTSARCTEKAARRSSAGQGRLRCTSWTAISRPPRLSASRPAIYLLRAHQAIVIERWPTPFLKRPRVFGLELVLTVCPSIKLCEAGWKCRGMSPRSEEA
jgi:hypothetical protein